MVLLLAPLAALLAVRVQEHSLAYFNLLVRMPKHTNFTLYKIDFVDEIQNCGDVVIVEAWV